MQESNIVPDNKGSGEKMSDTTTQLLSTISGVSVDDAHEIEQQIAELTRKNTISLQAAENFKATKKELTFPVLINILVIGTSIMVLFIASYMFNKQEKESSSYTAGLSSVEGQLIKEMRRISEAQLSAKDQQINDTQKYLQKLEQDKDGAIQNLEEQLRLRESELNQILAQDISMERDRLVSSGISESEIADMLAQFERERTNAYNSELEELRSQVEREQKAAEEDFIRLQNQYQQNLASLNTERQALQNELREQEQTLRTLTIQQAANEQQLSEQAQLELTKAQNELTALNERRQRSQMEEDQITGMYSAIQISLQEERYSDAYNRAENLVQFFEKTLSGGLDDTSRQRRNLDIFLASSLAQLARTESDRLANAANAQAQYLTTSETLERLRTEAAQNIAYAVSNIEQARIAANQNNYAGAIDAYTQAARSLNFNEQGTAALIASIEAVSRLAVDLNTNAISQENSVAAASLLTQGNQEFTRGNLRNAFNSYSQLIYSYPAALQVPDAINGITRIFDAYVEQTSSESETIRSQTIDITALTSRISDLEA